LRSLFEEHKLSLDFTWTQCQEIFANNAVYRSADNLERLTYNTHLFIYYLLRAFADYMKNLERLDYEEKKRIRRYHERRNRELFRELLEKQFKQGLFTIKTKWNIFVATIKDNPIYTNLVGQSGSSPKELFEDFILVEKDNFKRQKGTLKQIIKVI